MIKRQVLTKRQALRTINAVIREEIPAATWIERAKLAKIVFPFWGKSIPFHIGYFVHPHQAGKHVDFLNKFFIFGQERCCSDPSHGHNLTCTPR